MVRAYRTSDNPPPALRLSAVIVGPITRTLRRVDPRRPPGENRDSLFKDLSHFEPPHPISFPTISLCKVPPFPPPLCIVCIVNPFFSIPVKDIYIGGQIGKPMHTMHTRTKGGFWRKIAGIGKVDQGRSMHSRG
jgi:hypothetical protein